jgi:glycosyltransferase involved in cell wall biosynthesis
MVPIINQLLEKYAIEVLVISNQKPMLEITDYQFVKWSMEKEIEQLDKIDIGIMPLNDTIWEQGKCGFKALQYMALEKPTVVSDVGVNKKIVEHGKNGYLCRSEQDWIKYLSVLIENEALRKSMGKDGRQTVCTNYSVDSNAELFLSLFE